MLRLSPLGSFMHIGPGWIVLASTSCWREKDLCRHGINKWSRAGMDMQTTDTLPRLVRDKASQGSTTLAETQTRWLSGAA